MSRILEAAKIACLGAGAFALLAIGYAAILTGRDSASAIDSIRQDVHSVAVQTNRTTEEARQRIADTSSNLNASLIHLDLILGRTERISRTEEQFWNETSKKTLLTLDHIDALATGLDKSRAEITDDLHRNSSTLNSSLQTISYGAGQSLYSVRQATDSLNLLFQSPDLLGSIANLNSATTSLAQTSVHVEKTSDLFYHKTDKLLNPSKKRQAFNYFLDVTNLTAHSAQMRFYISR